MTEPAIQRGLSKTNVTDVSRAETRERDVPDEASITSSVEDHGQVPKAANTKEESAVESSLPVKDIDLTFPDGGLRAWLVVMGAVCLTFSTFGFVNAWGVFQTYYQETLLRDQSPSTIAWIGSLQYSLVFFPGLITGRLFDIGYLRLIVGPASVLHVIAVFLIAECKTYWQFVICQGVAIGITSGLIFGPTIAVVSHWFLKKRSRAYGVVAIGSSIGGTVIPIATRKLIPLVGFRWTVRILGFILLCTLSVANLAPRHVDGGLLNLSAFKFAPYTIYCISTIFAFLGLYTCLTYIDVAAAAIGVNPDLSFYLVSIANAASFVGRISSGFLADKYGPLNVLIPFTLLAGVMTYVWPYMTNFGSLIAIAVVYGRMFVGRVLGMDMTIMAVGALTGPPIAGAIRDASGSFHDVGLYAGE
ncbi:hypothetical protein BOTBODRAFT_170029 [Botryobasidium botryosum FD-172 SS1]|uniref:Major facilitator superfamily (MFS) profile domain-containing protein n=1 Tax=Botryobasidium botryosum (strain FD-172 SS1) TaxID=930990 RepID=A0A067N786_BOTB1|nr:hypothetical protein BOTBODRAFT_170029 [Botryobasidium botryosum FD-172 SS1]